MRGWFLSRLRLLFAFALWGKVCAVVGAGFACPLLANG